jgi:hypothetical protein
MHVDLACTKCIPFVIGEGPSEHGPRLGGVAPEGIKPKVDGLRYFLTVPVDRPGEVMMSVFSDPSEHFIFGGNAGKILAGSGVDVAFHGAVGRSKQSNACDSPLTPHPIVLLNEVADAQEEEGGEVVPNSANKLGGDPYLVERAGRLDEEVRQLLASGYRQSLQIDFPSAQDAAVSGDWPFGTGMFHVLTRQTDIGYEWRCFWEK